jgi:hypothetical protein
VAGSFEPGGSTELDGRRVSALLSCVELESATNRGDGTEFAAKQIRG